MNDESKDLHELIEQDGAGDMLNLLADMSYELEKLEKEKELLEQGDIPEGDVGDVAAEAEALESVDELLSYADEGLFKAIKSVEAYKPTH